MEQKKDDRFAIVLTCDEGKLGGAKKIAKMSQKLSRSDGFCLAPDEGKLGRNA